MRRRPGSARRSAPPRLERLETRALLAKASPKVTIQEVATGGGAFFVQILGTAKNDSITIDDNGKTTPGAVVVTTGDGQTFSSTNAINGIAVAAGRGSDRVTYNLLATLATDRFVVASSATPSVGNLPPVQGGGNLQLTVNRTGAVPSGRTLEVLASVDPKGKTSMAINDAGAIAGGVIEGIETPASTTPIKAGPVSLDATSTALIAPAGILLLGGGGGSAKNTMSATYAGRNDGDLEVGASGSGSQDHLAVDVEMAAGSIGTVGAKGSGGVRDTGRRAFVHLAIRRGADSKGTTGITASIAAPSKSSTAEQTANVANMAQGKDTVIA